MVTTLAPCLYCSGLVRQFAIPVGGGRVADLPGRDRWLRRHGVEIVDLASAECEDLLGPSIARRPEVWNEDIGVLAALLRTREA